MWKRIVIDGVLLAAGTFGLQCLDYLRLARLHSNDVYIFQGGATSAPPRARSHSDSLPRQCRGSDASEERS